MFEYQGLTYEGVAPSFVTPRIMTADEIAQSVLFLSSDAASSINGRELNVTDGQLAQKKLCLMRFFSAQELSTISSTLCG